MRHRDLFRDLLKETQQLSRTSQPGSVEREALDRVTMLWEWYSGICFLQRLEKAERLERTPIGKLWQDQSATLEESLLFHPAIVVSRAQRRGTSCAAVKSDTDLDLDAVREERPRPAERPAAAVSAAETLETSSSGPAALSALVEQESLGRDRVFLQWKERIDQMQWHWLDVKLQQEQPERCRFEGALLFHPAIVASRAQRRGTSCAAVKSDTGGLALDESRGTAAAASTGAPTPLGSSAETAGTVLGSAALPVAAEADAISRQLLPVLSLFRAMQLTTALVSVASSEPPKHCSPRYRPRSPSVD